MSLDVRKLQSTFTKIDTDSWTLTTSTVANMRTIGANILDMMHINVFSIGARYSFNGFMSVKCQILSRSFECLRGLKWA